MRGIWGGDHNRHLLDGLEGAVAGAGSRWYGHGGPFADGEAASVEVEDPQEVGAQIGDDEVFAEGVEEDLVRMRGLLAVGARAGCGLGEVEGLVERQGRGKRGSTL